MQIKIKRKEPELINALPRLIARLPESDSRKMNLSQQLYRIKAGYAGEVKVDRYLELFEFPQSSIILTDVQLALSPGHSFQIDTLILSKYYAIILEIKNTKGDLYFETDPHRLVRKLDGETTMMECPVTQLEVAKENLEMWFAQKGVQIEIGGQVVFANKKAIVKKVPPNAPILYLKRLSIYLREKKSNSPIYSVAQVQKMGKLIQQSKYKYNVYPLCEYYKIDPAILKKGQLCSQCNESMTYKTRRIQYCGNCKTIELNNARESIQDWFMLISNSISNRQCRYFLQLKNKDDAYYILKSLQLNKEGKSVATRYYWPKGISFKSKKPFR